MWKMLWLRERKGRKRSDYQKSAILQDHCEKNIDEL